MKQREGKFSILWTILLIVLPLMAGILALGVGRLWIEPVDILRTLMGKLTGVQTVTDMVERTVWNIRLPRVLLALLTGAGFSVAGCAFQSLFANPLATPDTLGVASGASFGAALGILLGLELIGIQLTSFVCGLLAVALTWVSGMGKGNGLSSVVLAGIMIGSLFSALVSLVKFVADTEDQLPEITYWLMGSLSGAGYDTLKLGALPILLGILILYLIRWRMNLLPLSDDEICSFGVNRAVLRGVTVFCATAMTASCVSMCGQVGWVGLLIPHICRMKFGSNHLLLIPASISLGATFLVVVDTIARSASAADIPISILTAMIGAPFFIFLMRKSGGWRF